MKKYYLLIITLVIFITGCKSENSDSIDKIVCKGVEQEGNIKTQIEVVAELENEKIAKVSAEMTFDDVESAKKYCAVFQMTNALAEKAGKKIDFECDGKSIKFKNYSDFLNETDQDAKIIGLTRKEFIDSMKDDENLTCE